MERFSRRLAALGLAMLGALAGTAQAQVVISQVYGGGGNAGATWRSDFIELHNTGSTAVDLGGWSVQYASAAGTSWTRTPLSGTIAPGGYYLVKQADGSGGTTPLPTPDATGTIAMSGTAGKVALVSANTSLSGGCPLGGATLDFVGFGGANCAETTPTAQLSNTTAAIRKDDGCTDSGNNSADFAIAAPAPRNSASGARVCGVSRVLLSIADAQVAEGQAGTRALTFVVSLTQPAGPGGVTLRWSTSSGSATAGEDYAAVAAGEATIPAGADRVELAVQVAGDTVEEADETLQVTIASATGAEIADGSATGTILNDDFPIIPISRIQGAGERSEYAGRVVATRGIVTGRKSTGFFIQSREIDADADPATSEGLFVFMRTMPDSIAPGRWVAVRGTVIEYVPSDDPGQAPLTELGGTVAVAEVDESVYPLPAPVALTTTFPSPTGGLDQLERVEGMRVTVPDFVVTAPTDGFTDERNALGSSNGIFHGTVGGLPRPFREPGIQAPDAPPAGTIPPIPQWDFNPELITVDSDAIGGARLDVSTGARIANLTGPLDYGFRRYTLLPDPSLPLQVAPGMAPHAAEAPTADAITVAGYNLERFFDDVNDGSADDATLTADAYARRLNKASLAIRGFLHTPDIVGLVEIESQKVVDDLAARLNADAVAAGDADPRYVGHLFEGNDPGGIDVAVLVKTVDTGAGTPRVQVRQVLQIGKDTRWTQPDGASAILNDRPPLLLDAVVHYADGRSFPLNVVVVHQRSLNGSEEIGASGERIRAKRQRQAEFLAGFLDGLQKQSDDARIVVLGDFNAFEFNDGLAHVMGTATGQPAPDAETSVAGDGADYVEKDLVNMGLLAPQAERYSFVFGGNAQTLDHVLVSEDLVVATRDLALDHARINADFPEVNRSVADSPSRLADHDPLLTVIVPRRIADLAVTASAPAQSHTGGELRFDVVLANEGPEQADRPSIAFDLDAEVDAGIDAPAGWECGRDDAPAGVTRLLCRAELLADGATAAFQLRAPATAALFGRTVALVTAVTAQSWDRNAANDAANASTTVVSETDVAVELQGPGKHLRRGTVGRYETRVSNLGPDLAVAPELVLWGDAPAANVAIDAPSGWDCEVAAATGGFQALCTAADLAIGASATFDVRIVGPQRAGDPKFSVHAQVDTRSGDAATANDTASWTLTLTGSHR